MSAAGTEVNPRIAKLHGMEKRLLEAWETYLRANVAVSPHTLRAYTADVHSFLQDSGTDEITAENVNDVVTLRAIRMWLADELRKGNSRSTVSPHVRTCGGSRYCTSRPSAYRGNAYFGWGSRSSGSARNAWAFLASNNAKVYAC